MQKIELLSQETIDKIAAGEVVERPASVVKELVENAIDAGATMITIEIKEGGISLIRITDNGHGIEKDQIPLAFLRHSTSKIKRIEDLIGVVSLGFRGEALSSIAAVSRVELITKTASEITGIRYLIEGSREILSEEIGAPAGTTFLVKDLFYNTPARRKFLKSVQTEAGYITDIVEKLALSHPDVSFKFINNNQVKLHTSGNGNIKDLIYHIFGRNIMSDLLEVEHTCDVFSLKGYIGKPLIARGNRNYEVFFINGRYIKSSLLSKAVEDAFKNYMMQHKFPFCVLYFDFKEGVLDVNVHPTKLELRFHDNQGIYETLNQIISECLSQKEFIPEVSVAEEKKESFKPNFDKKLPEPFEKNRIEKIRSFVSQDSPYEIKYTQSQVKSSTPSNITHLVIKEEVINQIKLEDYQSDFLTEDAKKKHRIIGQLFDTYWLIEYENKLFIVDQHAAHEKVLYEKTLLTMKNKEFTSQMIHPPVILTLNAKEADMFFKYQEQLEEFGYRIEHFGGKEYAVRAIPANLFQVDVRELLIEILDQFEDLSGKETPDLILEKIASMSCKAAVKGNHTLSFAEMDSLMSDLLKLDNPYHCPHGRPTIISMTKYEIEKKFKRIL